MQDTLILGFVILVVFGLIKVYSDKPQDSEGKTIMTMRDRIVLVSVMAIAMAIVLYVKVGWYGLGQLVFLSPILIGAYVIYSRTQKGPKKKQK